jgi:apolipoprotein D and lipocalin family protein
MTRGFRLAPVGLLLLGACASDPPLEVANVDLASFQGPWYEIAKLPRRADASCAGTRLQYHLTSDAELAVVVECRDGSLDGALRRVEARAVAADPLVPAKLTVDAEGFQGDHFIVEVDQDYTHAAIGDASRSQLSILARLPSLSNAEFSALGERLRKKGFDVSRLERTLQANETGSTSRPAPSPKDDSLRVTSRWRDTVE